MLLTEPQPEISAQNPDVLGRAFPGGADSYAIAIEGKYDGKGEVIFKALERLMKKDARILLQRAYVSELTNTFTLMVMCELPKASVDYVVSDLRKVKHVTNAQANVLQGHFFDGMMFPLLLFDSERVVAISPGLVFAVQETIKSPELMGALVEAGRKFGSGIIASIKERFAIQPDGKRDEEANIPVSVLEENTIRYLMATGWGRFSWDHGTSLERVFVHDPPCPKDGTAAGSWLMEGLVAGLAEGLQGKRFSVVEDSYDSYRRALTISMVETSVAIKMEQQEAAEKSYVESEVRRLANSVEQIQEPPEEIAVPAGIGGAQVALSTKSGPEVEAPAMPEQHSEELAEQKRRLEERTQELETLLKNVEGRISETKEGIIKAGSEEALENTAKPAAKHVPQRKSRKKKAAQPAYVGVLEKKSPGLAEEDFSFTDEYSI